MKCKSKVKLNFDYIDGFLNKNNITKTDFCCRIGHSNNWYTEVKKGKNSYIDGISDKKAHLICTVWGMEYDKLVAKQETTEVEHEIISYEKYDFAKAFEMISKSISIMSANQCGIYELLKNISAKVDDLHNQLK